MGIPDGKTKRILKLITDGENLNPLNLEAVYRWINDSYEALGFDPLQQQRFDEYSRSSFDSFSIRIDLGVRILKLALGAILSDSRDHSEPTTLNRVRAFSDLGKAAQGLEEKGEMVGPSSSLLRDAAIRAVCLVVSLT